MITFDQLQKYATKLQAQIVVDGNGMSIAMPQTKLQLKAGEMANTFHFSVVDVDKAYEAMKDWEMVGKLKSRIKIKFIKQFIQEKLAKDDRWAIKALVLVFRHQTTAEQNAERTVENNNIGFTGVDGHFLTSVAKQYLRRTTGVEINPSVLSEKQRVSVRKSMKKYWKQVYAASDEVKLLKMVAASFDSEQMEILL